MAVEKMRIIIDENGDVSVDMEGLKGKNYSEIIDILEKALGPAERFTKPEEKQDVTVNVREEEKVTT